VDVDLAQFFDRVNHDILIDRLWKRIDDAGVIRLVRAYLNSGIMDHGVVQSRHAGTPQGGPLSPLLANVLLDEVDKELERRGHCFARYADDANVYVGSKRAGERVMALLRRLYAKLHLKVNESKSAVASAGALSIDFGDPAGNSPGGEQVWVTLTDSAGKTLFLMPASTSQTFVATVPGPGNYYLTIADPNPSDPHDTGTYTNNPHIAWQPNTVYDGPVNNSLATAQVTPLGSEIIGTASGGDVDVFQIHAYYGGLLRATFGHPLGKAGPGAALNVDLLDSQGHVITQKTLAYDAVFDATLNDAGDFYVRISDASGTGSGGFYTFGTTLASEPGAVYDGASDTDAGHAQALPLSRELVGEMHQGDVDYYQFDLSSAGKLSLNFLRPGGPSLVATPVDVKLVDPLGHVVMDKLVSDDSDVTFGVAAPGQYTLQVTQPDGAPLDAGLYRLMSGFSSGVGVTSRGTAENTDFSSTFGNDTFFGYGALDTVTFHEARANYTVLETDAGVAVASATGVDGNDTLFGIDRLYFSDHTAIARDWNGSAGEAYRLYQAAFDRAPDSAGLGYWIYQHDHGMDITAIANQFVRSDEFRHVYGNAPTNAEIVTGYYEHVLHRAPDQAGVAYWVQEMDAGHATAAEVLVDFSRSQENFDLLVGVAQGFEYKVWA
jgi:hypothetical protein